MMHKNMHAIVIMVVVLAMDDNITTSHGIIVVHTSKERDGNNVRR